ncbi:UdgX family uracil-DNA binding protein [Mycobacterium sp. ACS4331]|uniref:UdgX family uracil-DNA binding protein n=1 Tax=Mycobacterium sp. ACS4331 TaxID=1834121 RepID=UPI000A9E8A80|nr:UdgX family uracil-DNA binding protein [Mycobacterium sp. ACS4331]
MSTPGAGDFVPRTRSLTTLARAVQDCRGCPLYRDSTQAVFGQGRRSAQVMLVGEQPGDREDLAGEPFVGPAGRILDVALQSAGIDRSTVYLTNAVKHFKFTREGKRRIHQTPSRTEVVACRPWLFAEIASVEPEVVVLLGATAAKALMGNDFRVTAHRGEVLHLPAGAIPVELDPLMVPTVHPSAILRGRPADRETALAALTDDLRHAVVGRADRT